DCLRRRPSPQPAGSPGPESLPTDNATKTTDAVCSSGQVLLRRHRRPGIEATSTRSRLPLCRPLPPTIDDDTNTHDDPGADTECLDPCEPLGQQRSLQQ